MKKISILVLLMVLFFAAPIWATHYEKPWKTAANQARLIDNMKVVDRFYYAARYYDPALGRFITPDSVMAGLDSQSLNPYSYCNNNPATLVDPSGNMPSEGNTGTYKSRYIGPTGHSNEERGLALGLTKTTPKIGGPGLRTSSFSWDRGRKKFFNKHSVASTIKSGLKLGRAAMGAAATVLLNPKTLGDATLTGNKSSVALDTFFMTRSLNIPEDGEKDVSKVFEYGSGARARNYGKHLQFVDQDITLDTLYYVTSHSYDFIKQEGIIYGKPYGLYVDNEDAQMAYYETFDDFPQSHVDGGIIASIVGNKNWVGFPIERGVWVNNPYCNQIFNSGIDTTLSNDLTESVRWKWGN